MDYGALSHRPGLILAAAIAVFLSGVLRGFSGFGSSLFSVPILSLMFAPSAVAPVMMGVQLLTGLQTLRSDRHFILWSCVTPLAIASSLTVMGGAVALISFDADRTRLIMGVIVAIAVIILMSGWRYHRAPRAGVSLVVGAFSGFLNGFSAMGGPPLVAFFLGGPFTPAAARSSMTFVFMVQGAASLACIAALGGLSAGTFLMMAAIFPLMAIGTVAGGWLFRVIGITHYRYISIGSLLVLAISLLVRAGWSG